MIQNTKDIRSILIIGSGPIVIGQGSEFDYAGVQACKALKEKGYKIILVNSNPATIMTDPDYSDVTYIEPLDWQELSKIISKERPDAILPTMGGQTALNCTLDLHKNGILEKYNVKIIGASIKAIEMAENRESFNQAMRRIGLEVPRSKVASNLQEAQVIQKSLGFPTIIRPSFTLGGSGGGIAYNEDEFQSICERGFRLSPIHTLLIEESLLGWKEFEMEVVRDKNDNCIIVCTIENVDPMGIHTGDSITVAPAQTLTDKEYQRMRNAAIAILREIGVDTGGSNVQFAVHPTTGRMVVIEMNPRVSRSSALASKATGFPIAKVAAKLAVGYTLDELKNDITNNIPASFEPTLDYVVTKIPRFNFDKFPGANAHLTTQMKSVGEVMSLGRTFQESIQKAFCSLEVGLDGIVFQETIAKEVKLLTDEALMQQLGTPSVERMLYIAEAFRRDFSLGKIYDLTKIDPFFLDGIRDIILTENRIKTFASKSETEWEKIIFSAKQKGFSDKRLAALLRVSETKIRTLRNTFNIKPVYKRVDSCAGEFQSNTAYLYSTYEEECESNPTTNRKIIILGSGPNRIGQGIEFDYCCVHAVMALREAGFETIMVNCNPETVSTDYDTADRLYFEPLTLESVLNIVAVEKPEGVIVHFGGQTPLKLVRGLSRAKVPILGTAPEAIDCAEDRSKFLKLLQKLGLKQPENGMATSFQEGQKIANRIGYPLILRPSYVLGGQSMRIIYTESELKTYFAGAQSLSLDAPILVDKYLENAIEVDVDAVSDGQFVFVAGILEHIEPAGIHSGDSTCSLPPFSLTESQQQELARQTTALAKALNTIGPINVQFAIQNNQIYVIEVNPRVSRTVPFVAKAIGVPVAKVATKCMIGKSLHAQNIQGDYRPSYFAVKSPVFPFEKFPENTFTLGPEMKSTGEVMGVDVQFEVALRKSQKAARLPVELSSAVEVYPLQELHKLVQNRVKSEVFESSLVSEVIV